MLFVSHDKQYLPIIILKCCRIRKRKRSNKYVLQGVLASENTENMILLQEMSTSMPELEKKFDDIFARESLIVLL